MTIEMKGPWRAEQIEAFVCASTLPIRLACVGGDGFPRVVSLWQQYHNGVFHCVTHQSAQLVKLLKSRPQVGFEIAADTPPYRGVRGQGTASLAPLGDNTTLTDMLSRYVGGTESGFSKWLLARSDEELLITVTPHRIFSWDYTQRMSGVV
jgi:nitroimidazol reductase NimA-like FMN-containing flavoprotein (pyridoxamine 5'-phosphate oxidase superfamily)